MAGTVPNARQEIDEIWEIVSVMVEAMRHAVELLNEINAKQDELRRVIDGGR